MNHRIVTVANANNYKNGQEQQKKSKFLQQSKNSNHDVGNLSLTLDNNYRDEDNNNKQNHSFVHLDLNRSEDMMGESILHSLNKKQILSENTKNLNLYPGFIIFEYRGDK
jgi:hypothetical protein